MRTFESKEVMQAGSSRRSSDTHEPVGSHPVSTPIGAGDRNKSDYCATSAFAAPHQLGPDCVFADAGQILAILCEPFTVFAYQLVPHSAGQSFAGVSTAPVILRSSHKVDQVPFRLRPLRQISRTELPPPFLECQTPT